MCVIQMFKANFPWVSNLIPAPRQASPSCRSRAAYGPPSPAQHRVSRRWRRRSSLDTEAMSDLETCLWIIHGIIPLSMDVFGVILHIYIYGSLSPCICRHRHRHPFVSSSGVFFMFHSLFYHGSSIFLWSMESISTESISLSIVYRLL